MLVGAAPMEHDWFIMVVRLNKALFEDSMGHAFNQQNTFFRVYITLSKQEEDWENSRVMQTYRPMTACVVAHLFYIIVHH